MPKKRQHHNNNKPNFWGFLQNVLIVAINKGQIVIVTLSLVIIIFAIKMPSDDVVSIIYSFGESLKTYAFFGWFSGITSCAASIIIVKRLRRAHTNEIRRISQQKKQLQQKLFNKKLPSSNK